PVRSGRGSNPRRGNRGRAAAAAARAAVGSRAGPAKGRDDGLAEELDRPHDPVRRGAGGGHEAEELGGAPRAGALDAPGAGAGSPTITAPISSRTSKVMCEVSRSRSSCA